MHVQLLTMLEGQEWGMGGGGGHTWGKDSRSIERTKKWPWNCDMLSPLLHRTRITPSQPTHCVATHRLIVLL